MNGPSHHDWGIYKCADFYSNGCAERLVFTYQWVVINVNQSGETELGFIQIEPGYSQNGKFVALSLFKLIDCCFFSLVSI